MSYSFHAVPDSHQQAHQFERYVEEQPSDYLHDNANPTHQYYNDKLLNNFEQFPKIYTYSPETYTCEWESISDNEYTSMINYNFVNRAPSITSSSIKSGE